MSSTPRDLHHNPILGLKLTFLGWLQKMGGSAMLKRAQKECDKLEIDLEKSLRSYSPFKISKRSEQEEKVQVLSFYWKILVGPMHGQDIIM